MTESENVADRHASWLELFFDLVVVVAVGQLAHLLHGEGHHGPDGLAISTFFALYLAIWLVWTTFTLYSNVVAEKVRQRSMFLGMAGIAAMAATVPHGVGDHSTVFAVAYLVTSAIGSTSFTRSGRILLSWSAATRNAGLTPWIAAFWVHDPWWRLGLWSLGLLLTVWASVLGGQRDGEDLIARYNQRLERRSSLPHDRGRTPVQLVEATVNPAHLGERLGLFVIIVLGEAMLQLIGAVAEIEDWSPGHGRGWLLLFTVAAGFALLIVLWALNVRYGFAEETTFPPALILPAHFIAIAAVTTVAVGLGSAVTDVTEHLPVPTAWLMCAGAAAYLFVVTALSRRTRRWPVSAVAIALPLVAAALAPLLPGVVVVVVLLAACTAQLRNLRSTS